MRFFIFTACLNKFLAKYSQTLIQHHPHLAPMEVCTQKFPIMWYFNVLPPSTHCHPRYTTTNWGEQVVALYCTIIFTWWHKDELCLDGLKINCLKTQTMHICNTKIKENGHQLLLLQYTTHTAVILLLSQYFYLAVLIYKVSVTWCQSAASFVIFVFKLSYICNSINQHYSSHLNIWRQSNQPQKRDGKSDTTEAHTI